LHLLSLALYAKRSGRQFNHAPQRASRRRLRKIARRRPLLAIDASWAAAGCCWLSPWQRAQVPPDHQRMSEAALRKLSPLRAQQQPLDFFLLDFLLAFLLDALSFLLFLAEGDASASADGTSATAGAG